MAITITERFTNLVTCLPVVNKKIKLRYNILSPPIRIAQINVRIIHVHVVASFMKCCN